MAFARSENKRVFSTCARKPSSPARSGPTHRLQRMPQAFARADEVQRCDILLLSERISPSARERVRRAAQGTAKRFSRNQSASWVDLVLRLRVERDRRDDWLLVLPGAQRLAEHHF